MDRSTSDSVSLLDRAAIALSGLCMLHCLALPLLLLLVPVFEQFAQSHFHLQMLIFVLPVSLLALSLGYRRHRHAGLLIAGATGMVLLVFGATWAHREMGEIADRLLTLSGSLILATAHYNNSRLARRHRTMQKGL